MFLNENEEKIIGNFMLNLNEFDSRTMVLQWNDGSMIIAKFDTCFEDEDENEEDKNYEEYVSFMFKALDVIGIPPVEFYSDNFLINYRNFPDKIIADGKKIN